MYQLLLPAVSSSSDDLSFNGEPPPSQRFPSEFLHEAVFAGGSFCALEAAYGNINGVVKTATGYFGGTLPNPSYKEVCEGGTGHTEAVKLVYDIRTISFISLCDIFWELHDSTNKLFRNFGLSTHQRSVIFYSNDEERKEAHRSKIRRQMMMNRRIVTKILEMGKSEFYLAENKHQKYYLQKYHRLCGSLGLRSNQHFVDSHIACNLNGILGINEGHMSVELATFLEIQELPFEARRECEEIIRDLRDIKKEKSSIF